MRTRTLWSDASSQVPVAAASVSQAKLVGAEQNFEGTCVDNLCASIFRDGDADGGLDQVLKCISDVRENIPVLVSSVCNANTSRLKAEETIIDSRREEKAILESMAELKEDVSKKKADYLRAKTLEQLAKSIAKEETCEKLEKDIAATEDKLNEMDRVLKQESERGAELSAAVKELFGKFEEVKKAAGKFQTTKNNNADNSSKSNDNDKDKDGNTKTSRRKAPKRHKFEDGELADKEKESNKKQKTEDTNNAAKKNGKQATRKKKVFEDVVSNEGKRNVDMAPKKEEEKKETSSAEKDKEVRRRKKFEDVEKDEPTNGAANASGPVPMDTEKKGAVKKEVSAEKLKEAKDGAAGQQDVKKENSRAKTEPMEIEKSTRRKKFEDIVEKDEATKEGVKSEAAIAIDGVRK